MVEWGRMWEVGRRCDFVAAMLPGDVMFVLVPRLVSCPDISYAW